jgi:hypothetical protein
MGETGPCHRRPRSSKLAQGTVRAGVHSDQMVLVMAGLEARLHKKRSESRLHSCKLKPKATQDAQMRVGKQL